MTDQPRQTAVNPDVMRAAASASSPQPEPRQEAAVGGDARSCASPPAAGPLLTARAALRREMIAARQALPAAAHRAASVAITHHLEEFLRARPAGTIAFCIPMRGEVDCRPVVEHLLALGWQAAMPVVRALNAPMEFRAWWPAAPMGVDPYGIPVPATQRCRDPDVMLLPLVAFDAAGYRLGYGGGYFDRTLAALPARPLTIGVGFELGAVADLQPQPHDIPLDLLATESGIRRGKHL